MDFQECKKCDKFVKVPYHYCFNCREQLKEEQKHLKNCISCDKKVKDPFIKCYNCNLLNKKNLTI